MSSSSAFVKYKDLGGYFHINWDDNGPVNDWRGRWQVTPMDSHADKISAVVGDQNHFLWYLLVMKVTARKHLLKYVIIEDIEKYKLKAVTVFEEEN